MPGTISKIWEFLSQPLLPEEARFWFSVVIFGIFVLFPFWVLAYGKYNSRRGGSATTDKENSSRGVKQR